MKFNYIIIAFTVIVSTYNIANGQIRVTTTGAELFNGTSAAIDLSTNPTANGSENIGKGVVYPEVNLTTFSSFSTGIASGLFSNFPTNFDGMLVFNTATGNAAIGDDGAGSPLAVSPGFYYYRNENRGLNGAAQGRWIRLLSGGEASTDTTIYSTDGNLAADRTVTMDDNYINFTGGNVGIGVADAQRSLVVNGAAVGAGASLVSATNIDFTENNLVRTDISNSSNFNIQGIVNGGTYSLVVSGNNGTTPPTFTVPAGFTIFSPGIEQTSGVRTIYTIVVMGAEVYIYQTTGLTQQ